MEEHPGEEKGWPSPHGHWSSFLSIVFSSNIVPPSAICSSGSSSYLSTPIPPLPFSHILILVTSWQVTKMLPLTNLQSVSSEPALCNPMDCSTPAFPVLHSLPEFAQIHAHWVGNALQPSYPLLPLSPPPLSLSQHQGLFQWVGSSHQMAKVLELQMLFSLNKDCYFYFWEWRMVEWSQRLETRRPSLAFPLLLTQ